MLGRISARTSHIAAVATRELTLTTINFEAQTTCLAFAESTSTWHRHSLCLKLSTNTRSRAFMCCHQAFYFFRVVVVFVFGRTAERRADPVLYTFAGYVIEPLTCSLGEEVKGNE